MRMIRFLINRKRRLPVICAVTIHAGWRHTDVTLIHDWSDRKPFQPVVSFLPLLHVLILKSVSCYFTYIFTLIHFHSFYTDTPLQWKSQSFWTPLCEKMSVMPIESIFMRYVFVFSHFFVFSVFLWLKYRNGGQDCRNGAFRSIMCVSGHLGQWFWFKIWLIIPSKQRSFPFSHIWFTNVMFYLYKWNDSHTKQDHLPPLLPSSRLSEPHFPRCSELSRMGT